MIGVVAQDAGGAEIISSYLRRNRLNFECHITGEARSVFARKFPTVVDVSLEDLVKQCDWLLCGTSVSRLENRALRLARQAGKPTVTMIDHWVHYRDRFFLNGETCFPDEVWLGDEIGLCIARMELPEVPAKLVPNPYFLDVKDELEEISGQAAQRDFEGTQILYVCDPVRGNGIAIYGDERYWGYTEEEALRYFLENVRFISTQVGRIVLRTHPKERRDKYKWVLNEFDLPIVTEDDKTLLQQVAASDVVAGCATMAMVVGLIAGKRVVSCIPPGGRTIPLPHPEIDNIRRFIPSS